MANPGYPPGPMQPPMGGPPMGGPPMGGPPMGGPPMGGPPMGAQPAPQPARKGTSKAVPIVVSAGLAIGTFCGLLFGLGTGDPGVAEAAKGNNVKKDEPGQNMVGEPSKVTDPGTPKIDKPAAKPAATVATGSGSAAPETGSAAPAAGSGSAAPASGTTAAAGSGSAAPASGTTTGSAAPTVPATKTAKLTIEVTPEAAAKDVKISIDKKDITGLVSDVDLGKDGKKTVALTVTAKGFHSVTDQKVEVDGDMTVKIELKKKAAAPAGNGLPRPGGKKDGKSSKTGGGGLIDI